MAVTTYSVTITCSSATVTALQGGGSALIGFSAVQGSDLSALPVVWLATTSYSLTTVVQWSTTYQAYASFTSIQAGTLLQIGSTQSVAVGQTCNVSAGAIVSAPAAGTPGYITIANTTSSPFTCGIEQTVNGTPAPICAYPLYGNNTQTIVPLPQIVLMFTTAPLVVGEMWSDDIPPPAYAVKQAALAATGPALSIDMSSQTTAAVTYDVNAGWSANGAWAQTIPASLITPTIIQPTPPPTIGARATKRRRG